MKPTQRDLIRQRLTKTMLADKVEGLETLLSVLKSDTKQLLDNYMMLDDDSLKLALEVLPDGSYKLNLSATTNRLFEVGKMIV